ncbi:MAG: glutamate racemase [Treponema sp.]|jgi:glutamate racemase|nr:glutamate racemase [Treponema sp.]
MGNSRPILFFDSGIGGISYCRHFHERNPAVPVVYLADRLHFPYGTKKPDEVISILTALVEQIIPIVDPQIFVIACNSAAVSALAPLRERFPQLPFVGVIPAVKPAALASTSGKIGVLATERTVNDPYIRELAAQFGGGEIVGIAAPELAEFLERHFVTATAEEKLEIARRYLSRFRAAGVDTLVLGCTHFLFLADEFRKEAAPDITIFESLEGISRRVESLLAGSAAEAGAAAEIAVAAPNRLLLTGSSPAETSWQDWADRLGFNLLLLEDA